VKHARGTNGGAIRSLLTPRLSAEGIQALGAWPRIKPTVMKQLANEKDCDCTSALFDLHDYKLSCYLRNDSAFPFHLHNNHAV